MKLLNGFNPFKCSMTKQLLYNCEKICHHSLSPFVSNVYNWGSMIVYFIICFDVTPDKKIGSLSRHYKYMKSAIKSCLVHGGYSIPLTK